MRSVSFPSAFLHSSGRVPFEFLGGSALPRSRTCLLSCSHGPWGLSFSFCNHTSTCGVFVLQVQGGPLARSPPPPVPTLRLTLLLPLDNGLLRSFFSPFCPATTLDVRLGLLQAFCSPNVSSQNFPPFPGVTGLVRPPNPLVLFSKSDGVPSVVLLDITACWLPPPLLAPQ